MDSATQFKFRRNPGRWLGGEPRVFSVDTEANFPKGHDFKGARLLTVTYEGGGLGPLFDQIAEAALVPKRTSFQALLEHLGELSDREPLIIYLRHSDRLLADVGPALIHVLTGWELFCRHGTGVHSMYLVL
jgi:hypothetical protein